MPIPVEAPPLPQVHTTNNHYVPYETDSYRQAHAWALEQLTKRYPGALEYVGTIESLIKQYLAGKQT